MTLDQATLNRLEHFCIELCWLRKHGRYYEADALRADLVEIGLEVRYHGIHVAIGDKHNVHAWTKIDGLNPLVEDSNGRSS